MYDEPTLLQQIETELITALTPLVSELEGVRQIEVLPFSTGEDIAVLLEKYRSRLPAAFLSIPTVDYQSDGAVRAADMTLGYGLLVGIGSQAAIAEKKKQVYWFHQQINRQVHLARIVNCEIPAILDFIRPQRSEVAEGDGIMALLTTFNVGVRNWQVREPSR